MTGYTSTEAGDAELGSADETTHASCNCCRGDDRPRRGPEPAQPEGPVDLLASGRGPDSAPLDEEPVPSIALATVRLSHGAEIEFSAVEEDSGGYGIALRELGDGERRMPSVLASTSRLSAFEIYRKLSPKGAVPRLIAAHADGDPGADLTDRIEPLEVDLDELGILPQPQASTDSGGGYGGHFCVPGDGWHAFKAFACEGLSAPSNAWFWCDPSVAYYWRDRWTIGHKRRNSFGITATCGAPAQTVHYYRNVFGNWKKLKTWYLPNKHWQWTRYCGLSKRDRWVHHRSSIQGPPSFVRSTTVIYT